MYFTPANSVIPAQLNWVTASYPICSSLIDSFTELCWVAPAGPHLMVVLLPFLGSLLITSALQSTSALCNCSLSIFTAMKCDYKSSWKVNKWNLEDCCGNRKRFPGSDFLVYSAHLKYIWLSEQGDVVAFSQTWEAPLRKRMLYLVVSCLCSHFWSLLVALQNVLLT